MLNIQILGIGCKKSRALKANLLSALRAIPLEVTMEEVNAIEDIIKYQIAATPALLINQSIISEGYVPEVKELQLLLTQYNCSGMAMKNILVPTDFSPVAANAFQFALDVAKQQESEVTVLHVYHPFFDPDNPLAGKEDKSIEASAQKQLEAFIGENISPADHRDKSFDYKKIQKRVRFGFASDEITGNAENFDLVIMGTTGDGDWVEQIFGSVSSHVAQHAQCPVLLVPPGAKFKGFKTVVYASDHKPEDKILVQRVVGEMQLASDAVHFVHVKEKNDENFVIRNGKHELIPRTQEPPIDLTLAEITAENILSALNEYARIHQADLIIMSTTHRSFIENIFRRSLTKQMVLRAKTPILILHTNN